MTRPPSRRRAGDERGVTVVLFALTLSVLITMSAFAVDIGQAYTERRHDQNTVDAAVMSAAVEAVLGGGEISGVVEEVRAKVNTTLGKEVTPEAWSACSDSDQLDHTTRELAVGNPVISPVTDCISFSAAFDRVRVKLPDQEAPGVFGPALGFGTITLTAGAEAVIQAPGGIGAPPFVALSTATQGDFVCLRTSDNPQPQTLLNGMGPGSPRAEGIRADPCDKTVYDTSSENYGTLQPYRYLDGCKQQNSDVEVAISLGIDHIMGYFKDGYDPASPDPEKSVERLDGGANCTVAFPNTFYVDTGFNAQGLKCALISLNGVECNGTLARLHQGPHVQTNHKFAGQRMDNVAPWQFLRPGVDLYKEFAPDECVFLAASRNIDTFDPTTASPPLTTYEAPTSYTVEGEPETFASIDMTTVDDADWDHYDRYDAFIQCLEKWDPVSGPVLFELEIAESPRFAFIPKVAEDGLLKVSKVHIESFLPSFMYRLYQSASSGTAPCDSSDPRATVQFRTHDAGQQFACGDPNQNVDRLSSIMLACGMVSDELCDKDTGAPDFGGQDIYDFRLSK